MGKVSIAQMVAHHLVIDIDSGFDTGKVVHTLKSLATRELCLRRHRLATRILLLVEFHLRKAHELRAANGIQTVELAHGRGYGMSHLSAKLGAKPMLQVSRG